MRCFASSIALIFLIACASGDPESSTALLWSAQPMWRVGGATSQQLTLTELYPFQVAVTSDRVWVIDRATKQLFLLDSSGHVIDTLGREGSGPGEFVSPWAVTLDENDGVSVVDMGSRKLVGWSRELALTPPVPIQEPLESPEVHFRGREGTFLATGRSADSVRQFELVQVTPTGRVILAALPRPPRRVADLPSCEAREISLTPLFAPIIHWDTRGSMLVVASGAEYAVDVYDGVQRVALIKRPIVPPRATEADALRAAENWMFNDCLVPPAEVVRAATYMERIPVVEDVALAPDSTIWVRRRTGHLDSLATDIFDLSGRFIGTLGPDLPFPVDFLDAERFVAIERDSLDVPSLVGYRLQRGAQGARP